MTKFVNNGVHSYMQFEWLSCIIVCANIMKSGSYKNLVYIITYLFFMSVCLWYVFYYDDADDY